MPVLRMPAILHRRPADLCRRNASCFFPWLKAGLVAAGWATLFVFFLWAAPVWGEAPYSVEDPKFHEMFVELPQDRWQAAVTRYYEGDLEGAAALLEELATVAGQDEARVRTHLAIVYRDLAKPALAVRQYQRLAELVPNDPRIQKDWAFAVLAQGDADSALRLFEDGLAIEPQDPWLSLGLGISYLWLGQFDLAIDSLAHATRLDDRLPLAPFFLGELYFQIGLLDQALPQLDRALRLDSNYVWVLPKLAHIYESQGRIEEAWTYHSRAGRVFPGDTQVQAQLNRFVDAHRSFLMSLEAQTAVQKPRVHRRVQPVEINEDTPIVRVGLVEGAEAVDFSAGGPFSVKAGDKSLSLPPGSWRMNFESGELQLRSDGSHGETYRFDHDIRLILKDLQDTFILRDLEFGRGYFFARQEDRQVRGDLEFLIRSEGMTVVNSLDIESYLLAVVPSEMYASMEMEALKAQAIAARTYTLRFQGRYSDRGFDVLGSVASAAYRGVDWEHSRTTEAVLSTRGQVLTYQGRLVDALYHSNAGGFTASSADVWGGTAPPYLRGVPEWDLELENGPVTPMGPATLARWLTDTPDVFPLRSRLSMSSTFRWVHPVYADEIQSRIDRVIDVGRIKKLVPGARSPGGHVSSVTVVGTKGTYQVRGDVIRSRLGGLKSNAFRMETFFGEDGYPRLYLFFGAGFGHGVGMSQFGAAGMAAEGRTAREILEHYFPGAEVTGDYRD